MAEKYLTLNQVKKRHPANKKNVRKIRKEIKQATRSFHLAELREMRSFSQEDLANILGINQSNISRTERNALENTEIGTLLAYVEALNYDLEIRVRTDKQIIQILGPEEVEAPKKRGPKTRHSKRSSVSYA